ncbi:MAG: glycosyltransferase [Halobacteriota archaeon]|nr:glycosyltransferase [Halobacteriota archaeon]
MNDKRGVGICTYNRSVHLRSLIQSVIQTTPEGTRIVVCDDGSTDETPYVVTEFQDVLYLRGPNLGVGANKNRALWALQDCAFIAILEDDLVPIKSGWFERYQNVAICTDIHHFCRVQDKRVEETVPEFTEWMKTKGYTPIYGPSPRGDFTFITNTVIQDVGGFHPKFVGAGYAHGEWSNRVVKAGLVPHPLRWIDILELSACFVQRGDTEGGRWIEDKRKIKEQLKYNHAVSKSLRRSNYIYHPLVIS